MASQIKTTSARMDAVRSRPTRIGQWLMRNWSGVLGIALLLIIVICALLAPWISPHSPTAPRLIDRFSPPELSLTQSGTYALGTDQLGRDMLSRIFHGGRVTLAVSLSAVLFGGVIGIILGTIAGYFGGRTDRFIMRLTDLQLAFPIMLLALMIIAALGPSVVNLVVVLALIGWTRFARIARGEILSLREREFVLSAVAAGASPGRLIRKHLLPNIATPMLVVATLELARLILMESSLSFLGLGVQPPDPSWGRMLADGRQYLQSAWWLSTFPGLAIMLVILAVNMTGDWMRDFYDPKLKSTR